MVGTMTTIVAISGRQSCGLQGQRRQQSICSQSKEMYFVPLFLINLKRMHVLGMPGRCSSGEIIVLVGTQGNKLNAGGGSSVTQSWFPWTSTWNMQKRLQTLWVSLVKNNLPLSENKDSSSWNPSRLRLPEPERALFSRLVRRAIWQYQHCQFFTSRISNSKLLSVLFSMAKICIQE